MRSSHPLVVSLLMLMIQSFTCIMNWIRSSLIFLTALTTNMTYNSPYPIPSKICFCRTLLQFVDIVILCTMLSNLKAANIYIPIPDLDRHSLTFYSSSLTNIYISTQFKIHQFYISHKILILYSMITLNTDFLIQMPKFTSKSHIISVKTQPFICISAITLITQLLYHSIV